MTKRNKLIGCLGMITFAAGAAQARPITTVTFEASRDNTIFNDPAATTELSNGAGDGIYVGRTATHGVRRGLIWFDVRSIARGSYVISAAMTLNCVNSNSPSSPVRIHIPNRQWGESTSNSPGGAGAPAQAGDATWLRTHFPDLNWATPGGDFFSPTASIDVGGTGAYSWTGPEIRFWVNGWISTPVANTGFILIGDENPTASSAKKFASRENTATSIRPTLTITYVPPCDGDINHDAAVNTNDLLVLLGSFGQKVPVGTLGDISNDGAVNTGDLVTFLARFGSVC